MKTKQLSIVLIFLATFLSCDKSGLSLQDFSIGEVNYGDCKSVNKSSLDEYLEIRTVNDFYLAISHINSLFNCVPGQIIVAATLEDNIIYINEYSTENLANCICPYDLNFSTGPLQYKTYTLSMNHANLEILNIEIDFNKNTDLRIDIE